VAGYSSDDSVKEEACRRFKAWVGGDQVALPPYLRRVVFGIVLSEDPTYTDYDAVLETYNTSQSADGKEIALSSIGDVTHPDLVKRTMDFVLSGEIPPQDIHSPCNSLAINTKTRDVLWSTMKQHWKYGLSKREYVDV
jgi:aminopeptidase 2